MSDGWGFIGSFNTEMATGGNSEGGQSMEAGASKNNFDYLHAINWKKAAEVVKAGKAEDMNGMKVIRLKTAVDEGVLYLIPEPKSPHGSDVDPSGRYIVVGGKLDPHVTIFDFNKMQTAIQNKDYEGTDPFGIPDPQVRLGRRRPGRGRRRSAAHAVRQQGPRLHQHVPRERDREVHARR